MRRAITIGTLVDLTPFNNKDSSRTVTVKEVLGEGAGSIAYLVEEDGLPFVMKECFPYTGADRDIDGAVVWRSGDVEAKSKSRFERAFRVQANLMKDLYAMNQTAHLAGSLYQANNTLCTLTIRKNARTYDKVEESGLTDIFVTAKSVASIVGAYHKAGYLHLDIKPENIMVYPETREMVQMIDFDSIISFSEKDLFAPSFSPKYAAPELLALDTKQICEATDIYEIGATVFEKIFGRAPESWDRSIFSDWDYSDNPLFEKLSLRAQRLTTELFRRTLAASVNERFQTTDDLISALDLLIKESDPGKRFIIDHCPACLNTFIGRESELNEIHDKLKNGGPVFITGMRGIGKTELAKNYARKFRTEYDVICFAEYNGSLSDLLSSGELVSIENNSDATITIESFAGLVDERTLLIIDNYCSADGNPTDGKLFDKLASLKCKLLLTTFEKSQSIYGSAQTVELNELTLPEQFRLFEKEYRETLTDDEASVVEDILKEVDGYTLLIPLIAKMLGNSCLSFNNVLENIKKAGTASLSGKVVHKKDSNLYQARVADIVSSVLNMSGLNEDEHYVMGCLSILEGIRVERSTLIGWIGNQYDTAVSSLAFKRWISVDGSGKNVRLSIHSVIRDIVKQSVLSSLNMVWIQKPVEDYIREITRCTTAVDPDDRVWSIFHGQPHPYGYPEMLENTPHLVRLFGVTAIQFKKKRKLVDLLCREMYAEGKVSALVTYLFQIIRWDLNCACNFAPDCDDILNEIQNGMEYASLSGIGKTMLHIERMFIALKSLCDCDQYYSREECEIQSLGCAVEEHARKAVSLIKEFGNDDDVFRVRCNVVFSACIMAGISLGNNLFTTLHPYYSHAALDGFSAFVNSLAAEIADDYPDYVSAGASGYSSFKMRLDRFNKCMAHDSFESLREEFDNYIRYDGMTKEEFEEINSMPPEEHAESEEELERFRQYQKADKLREDADSLVKECERAGYAAVKDPVNHPEISFDHLTDEISLKKAARLLSEAKDKYDQAQTISAWHSEYSTRWLMSSCIYACCAGEYSLAKEYYKTILKDDFMGFFAEPDKRIYNTLNHLGFNEICRDILRINIQYWEACYLNPEPRSTPNMIWQTVCNVLENAELLGDEEHIGKYRAIKKQLENPGYEIE